MMTGAALTASTAMSNCWCFAASDIRPGGMCGYQTNQMTRSAASARMSQIRKSRRPCRGSAGVPAAAGVSVVAMQVTTSMSPII